MCQRSSKRHSGTPVSAARSEVYGVSKRFFGACSTCTHVLLACSKLPLPATPEPRTPAQLCHSLCAAALGRQRDLEGRGVRERALIVAGHPVQRGPCGRDFPERSRRQRTLGWLWAPDRAPYPFPGAQRILRSAGRGAMTCVRPSSALHVDSQVLPHAWR